LPILNWKFNQFFGTIIKIVATRSHLLKLKCTKFDFGWGSAQTSLGELTALPRPFNWILGGPTSKGKEKRKRGETGKERKEVKRKGNYRRERGEEGKGNEAPN